MLDIDKLRSNFTDHENTYFQRLLQLNIINEEEIVDKKERQLTVDYRNFLYNILKYRNLKLEEEGTICKRLIKANRYLDINLLERDNYNLIRFSGIYLATDVIFLDPHIYSGYYGSTTEINTDSLGLPNNICFRSMHLITDSNNRSMAVALINSDLSDKYLTTYNSWSFPIF